MTDYQNIINSACEHTDLTEAGYNKAKQQLEEIIVLMGSGSIQTQAAAYCLSQYPIADYDLNANHFMGGPEAQHSPTMATDGIRIYFNPAFISYLYDNEHITLITTILCHELGHAMLLHPAITVKSAGLLARRGITPNRSLISSACNLMYDRIVDDFSALDSDSGSQTRFYIDADFSRHHKNQVREYFDSYCNHLWRQHEEEMKTIEAKAFCDCIAKHLETFINANTNIDLSKDIELVGEEAIEKIMEVADVTGTDLVSIYATLFAKHRRLSSLEHLKDHCARGCLKSLIALTASGEMDQPEIHGLLQDMIVYQAVSDELDDKGMQGLIAEHSCKNGEIYNTLTDPALATPAQQQFLSRSMGIYDSLDNIETKNVVMAMFEHIHRIIPDPVDPPQGGDGGGESPGGVGADSSDNPARGNIHVILPPEALKKDGSVDPSQTQQVSADISESAAQIAQQCQKLVGVSPLGMDIPMPEIDEPKVPLAEKFKQAIPTLKTKASMMRAHPAYNARRIMLPSRELGEPSIIMALDTSGSVVGSPDELRELMSEVMGALTGAGIHKVYFYTWDIDYYGPQELLVGDTSPEIVLAGGGGTNATPVFKHCVDTYAHDRDIVGLVILTDGYIDFDGKPEDLPSHWELLWLLSSSADFSYYDNMIQMGRVIEL